VKKKIIVFLLAMIAGNLFSQEIFHGIEMGMNLEDIPNVSKFEGLRKFSGSLSSLDGDHYRSSYKTKINNDWIEISGFFKFHDQLGLYETKFIFQGESYKKGRDIQSIKDELESKFNTISESNAIVFDDGNGFFVKTGRVTDYMITITFSLDIEERSNNLESIAKENERIEKEKQEEILAEQEKNRLEAISNFTETLPDNLSFGMSYQEVLKRNYEQVYSIDDIRITDKLKKEEHLNDTVNKYAYAEFDEEFGLFSLSVEFQMEYSDYDISPVTETIYNKLDEKYSIFIGEEVERKLKHFELSTMDIIIKHSRPNTIIYYKSLKYEEFLKEKEEKKKEEMQDETNSMNLDDF
jgi:hypothetical protein